MEVPNDGFPQIAQIYADAFFVKREGEVGNLHPY